ncbi:sensor histidine kinase [Fusibacter sp. JL298sf-3]
MKTTIRFKMRVIFTAFCIVVPLILLTVFNVTMRRAIESDAKEAIVETFETIKIIVKENIARSHHERPGERPVVYEPLNSALRVARRTADTELYAFYANGELMFPKTGAPPVEIANLLQSSTPGHLSNYVIEGVPYIGTFFTIGEARERVNIVLLASLAERDAMIVKMNRLIVGLSALFVLAGIGASTRLSRAVVKPMELASNHAKAAENGVFQKIEEEADSLETERLFTALNQMSATLEKNEQAQTTYIQNISHDLRTPLMSIQGYAEGIKTGVFEDYVSAASIIAEESLRLKHYIEKMLALSRLESNMARLNIEALDWETLMTPIFNRYRILAEERGAELVSTVSDDGILYTDSVLFESIVSNAMSNALRYCKTRIEVCMYREGETTVLKVLDDGAGVDEEKVNDFFERFQSGDDGAFGLGLAIVKTSADRLGATVSLTNTPEGTCFSVRFPVK